MDNFMLLKIVTDAAAWDAFVSTLPRAQFTQSWAWGEFRKSRGQKVVRLMGGDAAALFFKYPAPLVGGYWYAPRGPVGKSMEAMRGFLEALVQEKALSGRALFWRVEPLVESVEMPKGFIRSHAYMPASTLLLDLTQPEEVLQSPRIATRRHASLHRTMSRDV